MSNTTVENTVSAPVAEVAPVASSNASEVLFKRIQQLKGEMGLLEKLFKEALKEASKNGKAKKASKKDPSAPKGELPPQTKAHNERVNVLLEQMRASGWEEYKTKKGEVCPKSIQNAKGLFVFEGSISEKFPEGRQPNFKDALTYKGFVEPAPLKEKTPAKKEKKEKEIPAPVVQEKKVEVVEEKPKKEKKEKVEKPKKEKVEKAEKAEKAEKPKKEKKEKKAEVVKTEVVAPVASTEEEEAESVTIWTFKGKSYYRTSSNECWECNKDNSKGKWAGVYDPVADKIDDSVAEPELEWD
jgi:hypothetical protein